MKIRVKWLKLPPPLLKGPTKKCDHYVYSTKSQDCKCHDSNIAQVSQPNSSKCLTSFSKGYVNTYKESVESPRPNWPKAFG